MPPFAWSPALGPSPGEECKFSWEGTDDAQIYGVGIVGVYVFPGGIRARDGNYAQGGNLRRLSIHPIRRWRERKWLGYSRHGKSEPLVRRSCRFQRRVQVPKWREFQ